MLQRLLALSALSICVCLAGCEALRSPFPVLNTPEWSNSARVLMMRYSRDGHSLLLAAECAPWQKDRALPVYKLCPRCPTLRVTTRDEWDSAGTPITDSTAAGGGKSDLGARRRTFSRLLKSDEEKIESGILETRRISFDGYSVALEGTNVWIVSSGFWPLNGKSIEYLDPFYTQLIGPDGTPVGEPTVLPFWGLDCWMPSMCLSSDGSFVVYVDDRFSRLCVVPVDVPSPPAGERRSPP